MSSEKTIQNALYWWRTERGHPFIAPNVSMPAGEMDLVSVTGAGFVYEHEIKISRADFKADFRNKQEKHVWLAEAKKLKGECAAIKRKFARFGVKRTVHCANYFFYVCPENLLAVEEIPIYAGLCYWRESKWNKNGEIRIVKDAPRLHSEKITKERMQKLAVSMMFRYWRYRLRENI